LETGNNRAESWGSLSMGIIFNDWSRSIFWADSPASLYAIVLNNWEGMELGGVMANFCWSFGVDIPNYWESFKLVPCGAASGDRSLVSPS